jgi:hypothetical protein
MKPHSRGQEESKKLSSLLLSHSLFGAFFDPEDGRINFLRNVGELVQDYTVTYIIRY